MLDILIDALLDTLKLTPFLYLSYLFIEYVEHKASDKIITSLYKVGKTGPVLGAAAGIIPMCGLSVSAVDLYANRLISVGTLVALLISCSDEALPVLFSSPATAKSGLILIISKFVIGAAAGLIMDSTGRDRITPEQAHEKHELMHRDCEEDECEKEGIFLTALLHTLKSAAFVFAALLFMGLLVAEIGEDVLMSAVSSHPALAPLLAAVIGLIPNCAPSILLSELYAGGMVSFGAMLSGLIVNSGVGLAILWKQNKDKKQNLVLTLILFMLSILAGTVFHLLSV